MQQTIVGSRGTLATIATQMPMLAERRLTQQRHQLQLTEEKVKGLDPTLLLSRGYSITLKDGKAVRHASELHHGDEIVTRLAEGTVKSTVK